MAMPPPAHGAAASGSDVIAAAVAQERGHGAVVMFPITPRPSSGPPPAAAATSESYGSSPLAGASEVQDDATLMRLLEALMTHTPDVFLSMSAREEDAGVIHYVSPSIKNVLGWEPEQLVGRHALEFAYLEDAERLANTLRSLLSNGGGGEPANSMHRSRTPDGFRWVHARLWRDQGLLLCAVRDSTRFASAQAASREYLLSTSHDLRTPCHAIVTAGQLLAARESVSTDPDAAFLVDAVCSGCALLLGVISNVLDMRFGDDVEISGDTAVAISPTAAARATHEMRLNLKPVSCAPRELIAGVLRTCRIGCGLLRGRLEWVHEDAPLPSRVCADVDRLQRVLQNLVLYSLKNSPGNSTLTLEVTFEHVSDSPHASGVLRVAVCDPERQLWTEECARIFAPRVAGRPAGALDSCCGLGLFVARTCARAMGGDVFAKCVGSCGGSVLVAQLPVGLPPGACVDDHHHGAAASLAGASPSAAHLAAESAAYAELASGDAKRRRKDADTSSTPPPQAAAAPESVDQRPPRCLLVDDHMLNIKLVQRLLERHGFEARVARAPHDLAHSDSIIAQVTTAMNGLEALQSLQASLTGQPGAPPPPDIALVDLQMPVMGGLELARRFREWCVRAAARLHTCGCSRHRCTQGKPAAAAAQAAGAGRAVRGGERC